MYLAGESSGPVLHGKHSAATPLVASVPICVTLPRESVWERDGLGKLGKLWEKVNEGNPHVTIAEV